MKGNTNHTSSPLTAFKRAPSLGLSQWENGNLTTNLAEKKDTNGAFLLMEATLAPGTEPPPHVHTREDELFYVLEGELVFELDGERHTARAGDTVYLRRGVVHTYQNFTTSDVQLLIATVPGMFSRFFVELSAVTPAGALQTIDRSLHQGQPFSDLAGDIGLRGDHALAELFDP